MLTIDGALTFGLERDGKYHKEFTLRVPTLEDVEIALEDAGLDACAARVSRHRWACCMTRLGDIPKKEITADLLASLPAYEYGVLEAAEEELLKKLASASAGTSTPSA